MAVSGTSGRPEAPRRFVGGALFYVLALVVALFSAVASFVLIALVAVYYVLENTPVYAAPTAPATTRTWPESHQD